MPDGHSTRTTSAPERRPRPNTTSAGAAAGVAAEVSTRALRLPARTCTFDPTPRRLLTSPLSRTRCDFRAASPLLRQTAIDPRLSATRSVKPSPSMSPVAKPQANSGAGGPGAGATALALTSDHPAAGLRETPGPAGDHRPSGGGRALR